MWTKKVLQETIRTKMADYRLVVVSNRQPYSHMFKSGKIECHRQPGGLVTALDPVLQAANGTWIAVGTSPQDRMVVDRNHKIKLPPEHPSYDLKRIFLTKEEMDQYYYGYCNEGIWPLSHLAYTRPMFLTSEWEYYQKVNEHFAREICDEVGDDPAFVWVQDFHLALVAKYLKDMGKTNIITSLFWHIPWPGPEIFRICPQKKELVEGLLAYDLLAFQIRYHADNFLATVDREVESRIDREKNSVFFQNHETMVRGFPISVDFQAISDESEKDATPAKMKQLRENLNLGNRKLIVGVDRIDYTKGIPDRLRAIDRFLEKYPDYRGKFVFFQIGQVSRIHVQRYKHLNDELNALVEEINWKHSQDEWSPVFLTRSYMSYEDILTLYRMADLCIVSSLDDGMNLVAKEFVAARPDLRGVLLLSQFTGSARELTDAVIMNPYDTESFADAIALAMNMPEEEQEKRMAKMREVVQQNNIYRWAGKVLSQLLQFEFQEV